MRSPDETRPLVAPKVPSQLVLNNDNPNTNIRSAALAASVPTKRSALYTVATFTNYTVFGVCFGAFYFLTSFAGILRLIDNPYCSVPLGLLSGGASALVNGLLTPRVTSVIFSRRPDVWLLTPFVFLTVGGLSALPSVAAVLQANQEIDERLGIPLKSADAVLGNSALLILGIAFSVGITGVITTLWAYFQHLCRDNAANKIYLQRRYLNSFRSVEEYDRFIENPDDFLKDQYSRRNFCILVFSLFPILGLSLSVAEEIPKVLAREQLVKLMGALNFFNLIPIDQFAKTFVGCRVVSCVTGVPFNVGFIATALRVMLRDYPFAYHALREKSFSKVLAIAGFHVFTALTCATALFQGIKGGASLWLILSGFLGAFLANYSGPWELYFSHFLPRLSQLCCKESGQSALTYPAVSEGLKAIEARAVVNEREKNITIRGARRTSFHWEHPAPGKEEHVLSNVVTERQNDDATGLYAAV